MNIFIDESGTFAESPKADSWNAVAALVVPESSRARVERAVQALKASSGSNPLLEVKLSRVDEGAYKTFLESMTAAEVSLFAKATDASTNTVVSIRKHQATQVLEIRRNIPLMRYPEGKESVAALAARLEGLSPQLYVQLVMQIDLLRDVIERAINYYAQRIPATLRQIRWRIDQKNTTRTDYERAFEQIAPALLQSGSFREPFAKVEGFDYRHFADYEFKKGEGPTYLKTEYGIDVGESINIQKLLRGDLRFVDSKSSTGIQAVDLLASGIRRCLRKGFADCEAIAVNLGRLMIGNRRGKPPIALVTFDLERVAPPHVHRLVDFMWRNSRPLIAKHPQRRRED